MATNTHYKPTDSHSYLDYTSAHLASCKDAISFPQFLRLQRICSDEANIDNAASKTSTFFLNRGYPTSIVGRALNQVRLISHTSTLTPSLPSRNSDRVPLVLTYHPTSIHIQKIIRCHFHHLQRDATTKHVFPFPPLSTFRRHCSLRDTLVYSAFTPSTLLQPHGIFPCE
eukprot:g20434.t1